MAVKARTRFAELMASKTVPYGVFISSTDPQTTDIAAAAGFDFVIIDREHGPHDNATALGHIRAAEAGGMIPFIRVLENSRTMIQAALDLGAHGVVVPKVETADDARAAVEASLYAPKGFRGMCNACHAANFMPVAQWPEHQRESDANVILLPLIETRKATENIEEILDVPGIDFVFVGPGDLSNDMGINLATEAHKLMAVWRRILDAAHARGKFVVGIGYFGFEDADIHCGSSDLLSLREVLSQNVADHRSRTADAACHSVAQGA